MLQLMLCIWNQIHNLGGLLDQSNDVDEAGVIIGSDDSTRYISTVNPLTVAHASVSVEMTPMRKGHSTAASHSKQLKNHHNDAKLSDPGHEAKSKSATTTQRQHTNNIMTTL